MQHDYRQFIGLKYQAPHGCFRLVAQVYVELYGIDLGPQDEGLDPRDRDGRVTRLHDRLQKHCTEVEEPREGDIILMRSNPCHIGVVVDPEQKLMLHSYGREGGAACLECWDVFHWRNRVQGFWRYEG